MFFIKKLLHFTKTSQNMIYAVCILSGMSHFQCLLSTGWWLVADGWWLVAGGWWLVAGGTKVVHPHMPGCTVGEASDAECPGTMHGDAMYPGHVVALCITIKYNATPYNPYRGL